MKGSSRILSNSVFMYLILLVILIVTGCYPKVVSHVTQPNLPLEYHQEVKLIQAVDSLPTMAQHIGNVQVKSTGFTIFCDFHTVIYHAHMEARKAGAQILKITNYKQPDIWNTCHRIEADLYRVNTESTKTEE